MVARKDETHLLNWVNGNSSFFMKCKITLLGRWDER